MADNTSTKQRFPMSTDNPERNGQEQTPTQTPTEWTGEERRRGRPLTSRGPIIISLEILNAIAGLLAIAALIFALIVFSSRLDFIQSAREKSAFDTCTILDKLIDQSGKLTNKESQALDFERSVGLSNCTKYSKNVRLGHRVLKITPQPHG